MAQVANTIALSTVWSGPLPRPTHVRFDDCAIPALPSLPAGWVAGFYGFAGKSSGMKFCLRHAQIHGLSVVPIEFSCPLAKPILANMVSAETLSTVDFLHFERAKRALRSLVDDWAYELLQERGFARFTLDAMNWKRGDYFTLAPDLAVELLAQPEYSHLKVFAFPYWIDQQTYSALAIMRRADVTEAKSLYFQDTTISLT